MTCHRSLLSFTVIAAIAPALGACLGSDPAPQHGQGGTSFSSSSSSSSGGSGGGGGTTSSTGGSGGSGGATSSSSSSSSSGGGACDPSAWVYMGNDPNACAGHLGESCGWTTANEGQGYHCQTVSWGIGCEPGGTTCPGGSTSNSTSSNSSTSSSSSGGTGGGSIEFAPYFETWAWGDSSYPFTGLVDLKAKSGVNGVTIAFVLSNGGCAPTEDVQDNQADVDAFKASGGLVKASFGGADGTYLEAACGSAGALAGAIGAFVDETGITDLDFDVEQGPVMTTAVNQMRGQALAEVQAQKGILVSFTLPVGTTGLDDTGLDVVTRAVQAGVTVSHVNLMVMDYGPSQTGSMSLYAEQALTATQAQLTSAIPGLSGAAAWSMLGATPMIGQNDQAGEIFTLADAQSVASFAQQKQIGLLSFWSIQRDRPGTDYNESSTVNTQDYQFAAIFSAVE
jgi:Glycosyl hydrolases family 18